MSSELKRRADPALPPLAGSTISLEIEEVKITEHPQFHVKRWDWGVRKEYTIPAWIDEETGEYRPEEIIPEDRSGHMPELDGLAWADMWGGDDWRIVPPGMHGITKFLRPKMTVSSSNDEDWHPSPRVQWFMWFSENPAA